MDKIKEISPIIIKEIAEQRKNKLGKLNKPKGSIFEYDINTGNIILAKFIQSEIKGENNKLYIKDNRIYLNALNKENAIKKLLKKKIWFHTIKST